MPESIVFQLKRWTPFFTAVIVAACAEKTGSELKLALSRKIKILDDYAATLYRLSSIIRRLNGIEDRAIPRS